MLYILVVLDDVHVGTNRILQRQVYHFTHSHRARTTHCAYKPSVDAQLVDQTHSHLKRCPSGSFLTLVPGHFMTVLLEGFDCFDYFLSVGLVEDDIVAIHDGFVDEFGVYYTESEMVFEFSERWGSVI